MISISGTVRSEPPEAVSVHEMERVMQGQIIKFQENIGFGVISAADGRKYRFAQTDIRNPNGRLVGLDVDFLVESHSPRDIILLHGSPWTVFGRTSQFEKRS